MLSERELDVCVLLVVTLNRINTLLRSFGVLVDPLVSKHGSVQEATVMILVQVTPHTTSQLPRTSKSVR